MMESEETFAFQRELVGGLARTQLKAYETQYEEFVTQREAAKRNYEFYTKRAEHTRLKMGALKHVMTRLKELT